MSNDTYTLSPSARVQVKKGKDKTQPIKAKLALGPSTTRTETWELSGTVGDKTFSETLQILVGGNPRPLAVRHLKQRVLETLGCTASDASFQHVRFS